MTGNNHSARVHLLSWSMIDQVAQVAQLSNMSNLIQTHENQAFFGMLLMLFMLLIDLQMSNILIRGGNVGGLRMLSLTGAAVG
jgi:hypothetical protein